MAGEAWLESTVGGLNNGVAMDTAERSHDVTRPPTERPEVERPRTPAPSYRIQRRGTRVRIRARIPVRLQHWDATLLDISLSGALVEHAVRVRPGQVYRLAIPIEGRPVQLQAQAVRAFVSHLVRLTGGQRQVVYRTGLEFMGVEAGVARLLSAHINRLFQQG